MKNLNRLQSHNMYRPYIFDRVTAQVGGKPFVSILGNCYSEFKSGPNLVQLANSINELNDDCKSIGLLDCRYIEFKITESTN